MATDPNLFTNKRQNFGPIARGPRPSIEEDPYSKSSISDSYRIGPIGWLGEKLEGQKNFVDEFVSGDFQGEGFNPLADIKGYERYVSEFVGLKSPSEVAMKKRWLDERNAAEARRSQRGGWNNFKADLFTSVVSPESLIEGPAVLGKGLVYGLKAGLKYAGPLEAGIELGYWAQDPNATDLDLAVGTATAYAGGTALSGVFGAIPLGRAARTKTLTESLAPATERQDARASSTPVARQPVAASRPVGGQRGIVSFVMNDLEGGARSNVDSGGLTKFGISTRGNPGVDIANLTEDQAVEIYRKKYWLKEFDGLPEGTAAILYDASVNQGPGMARKWLKESGGDPARIMQLRRDHYAALIRKNPGKYAQYEKGWNNRLAKLEGFVGGSSGRRIASVNDAVDELEGERSYREYEGLPVDETPDEEADFDDDGIAVVRTTIRYDDLSLEDDIEIREDERPTQAELESGQIDWNARLGPTTSLDSRRPGQPLPADERGQIDDALRARGIEPPRRRMLQDAARDTAVKLVAKLNGVTARPDVSKRIRALETEIETLTRVIGMAGKSGQRIMRSELAWLKRERDALERTGSYSAPSWFTETERGREVARSRGFPKQEAELLPERIEQLGEKVRRSGKQTLAQYVFGRNEKARQRKIDVINRVARYGLSSVSEADALKFANIALADQVSANPVLRVDGTVPRTKAGFEAHYLKVRENQIKKKYRGPVQRQKVTEAVAPVDRTRDFKDEDPFVQKLGQLRAEANTFEILLQRIKSGGKDKTVMFRNPETGDWERTPSGRNPGKWERGIVIGRPNEGLIVMTRDSVEAQLRNVETQIRFLVREAVEDPDDLGFFMRQDPNGIMRDISETVPEFEDADLSRSLKGVEAELKADPTRDTLGFGKSPEYVDGWIRKLELMGRNWYDANFTHPSVDGNELPGNLAFDLELRKVRPEEAERAEAWNAHLADSNRDRGREGWESADPNDPEAGAAERRDVQLETEELARRELAAEIGRQILADMDVADAENLDVNEIAEMFNDMMVLDERDVRGEGMAVAEGLESFMDRKATEQNTQPDTSDQDLDFMAAVTKSVDGPVDASSVMAGLATSSTNAFTRFMAAKLAPLLQGVQLRGVDRNGRHFGNLGYGGNPENFVGRFIAQAEQRGVIWLNEKGGFNERVFLHEAMHAVLVDKFGFQMNRLGFSAKVNLAFGDNVTAADLPKEVQALFNDLDGIRMTAADLWERAKDRLEGYSDDDMFDIEYGLSSLDEFTSVLIDSPALQRFLSEFSVDAADAPLWKRVVEAIRKFFGLPQKWDTALDAAMDATLKLVDKAGEGDFVPRSSRYRMVQGADTQLPTPAEARTRIRVGVDDEVEAIRDAFADGNPSPIRVIATDEPGYSFFGYTDGTDFFIGNVLDNGDGSADINVARESGERLSPKVLRAALKDLSAAFPEIRSFGGMRTTGARAEPSYATAMLDSRRLQPAELKGIKVDPNRIRMGWNEKRWTRAGLGEDAFEDMGEYKNWLIIQKHINETNALRGITSDPQAVADQAWLRIQRDRQELDIGKNWFEKNLIVGHPIWQAWQKLKKIDENDEMIRHMMELSSDGGVTVNAASRENGPAVAPGGSVASFAATIATKDAAFYRAYRAAYNKLRTGRDPVSSWGVELSLAKGRFNDWRKKNEHVTDAQFGDMVARAIADPEADVPAEAREAAAAFTKVMKDVEKIAREEGAFDRTKDLAREITRNERELARMFRSSDGAPNLRGYHDLDEWERARDNKVREIEHLEQLKAEEVRPDRVGEYYPHVFDPRKVEGEAVNERGETLNDVLTAYYLSERGGRLDLPAAREKALAVEVAIKGDPETMLPGLSGHMKHRALDIPTKDLLPWLVTNPELIMQQYLRRMGGSIAMLRKFGDVYGLDFVDEQRARLLAKGYDEDTVEEVLQLWGDQRDRILGVLHGRDPLSMSNRIVRGAKQVTNLLTMGSSIKSQLSDPAKQIMIHKAGPFFQALFRFMDPVYHELKGKEGYLDELVGIGGDIERARIEAQMVDADASVAAMQGTKVERWLQKSQAPFFILNLLGPFTQQMKRAGSYAAASNILKEVRQVADALDSGGTVDQDALFRLKNLGIDEDMARLIASMPYERQTDGKLWFANAGEWAGNAGERARLAFYAAVRAEATRATTTPGGLDRPLAADGMLHNRAGRREQLAVVEQKRAELEAIEQEIADARRARADDQVIDELFKRRFAAKGELEMARRKVDLAGRKEAPVVSLPFQLKSFTIASTAKTLHGIMSARSRSRGAGIVSLMAAGYLASQWKAGEAWEYLSWQDKLSATFDNSGLLAWFGDPLEALDSVTDFTGPDWNLAAESDANDEESLSTEIGMAGPAFGMATTAIEAFMPSTSEDQRAKSIRRMIPYGNLIWVDGLLDELMDVWEAEEGTAAGAMEMSAPEDFAL